MDVWELPVWWKWDSTGAFFVIFCLILAQKQLQVELKQSYNHSDALLEKKIVIFKLIILLGNIYKAIIFSKFLLLKF